MIAICKHLCGGVDGKGIVRGKGGALNDTFICVLFFLIS